MKYYSELTGGFYNTKEDLAEAERLIIQDPLNKYKAPCREPERTTQKMREKMAVELSARIITATKRLETARIEYQRATEESYKCYKRFLARAKELDELVNQFDTFNERGK